MHIKSLMEIREDVQVSGGVVSVIIDGKRVRVGMMNKDGSITFDEHMYDKVIGEDKSVENSKPEVKKKKFSKNKKSDDVLDMAVSVISELSGE